MFFFEAGTNDMYRKFNEEKGKRYISAFNVGISWGNETVKNPIEEAFLFLLK